MIAIVHQRFSARVPADERRAADNLRLQFLGAVGRSGKSIRVISSEIGLPERSLHRFSYGGHLNVAYHKAVIDWIPKQRTDLALARQKRAS
jgi:hypothetical protein